MNILNKIKSVLRRLVQKGFAKKYGEYQAAQIQSVITAMSKTLNKADKTKVDPMIHDVNVIITDIKNFVKNHGVFLKELGASFAANLDTKEATKKMEKLVKDLEPIFTNK